jgi:hypothetical protein
MPIPNFFIVGSWKAGTTSIYRYLEGHPEVFMSPVKEPHYFVHHSKFRPRLFWLRSSYLGLFKNAGDAKVIGEASAYYFCMPESPQMIHDFNPLAKIVIMLRNPVDVIYAFHSESIFLGRETRGFAQALQYQESHPRHVPNYIDIIRRWPQQIREYQRLFGKERVHIIIFDDLAADPRGVYERLLDFLGVDKCYMPEFIAHNPSKVAPSKLFSMFSGSPIVVAAVRVCYLSSALAIKIGHFRQSQKRIQPRPPMDEKLRRHLTQSFHSTVDTLSEIVQRDLSNWKQI